MVFRTHTQRLDKTNHSNTENSSVMLPTTSDPRGLCDIGWPPTPVSRRVLEDPLTSRTVAIRRNPIDNNTNNLGCF